MSTETCNVLIKQIDFSIYEYHSKKKFIRIFVIILFERDSSKKAQNWYKVFSIYYFLSRTWTPYTITSELCILAWRPLPSGAQKDRQMAISYFTTIRTGPDSNISWLESSRYGLSNLGTNNKIFFSDCRQQIARHRGRCWNC